MYSGPGWCIWFCQTYFSQKQSLLRDSDDADFLFFNFCIAHEALYITLLVLPQFSQSGMTFSPVSGSGNSMRLAIEIVCLHSDAYLVR